MRKFFVIAPLVILLAACSPAPAPVNETEASAVSEVKLTATAAPTATPEPTSTPEPTATPVPTETSTPEPTAMSEEEFQAILTKWQPLVSGALITVAGYESLLDTVERIEAGELSGDDAYNEILAGGFLLGIFQQAIEEWEPEEELDDLHQTLIDHMSAGTSAVGDYLNNGDVSIEQFREALETEHQAAQDTLATIMTAARDDGLTDAHIEEILAGFDELADTFDEPLDEDGAELTDSDADAALQETTVTLVCEDCAEIGMDINLWDSPERNSVTGQVPHGTEATVIEVEYNSDEARDYYHVEAGSESGWLPEDFVQP